MKTHTLLKGIFLTAALVLFSISSFTQTVGVSDVSFTPQSLLHVHSSGSGAASLFQITNGLSGNGSNNVGFTFDVDASFNIFMNNHQSTYLGFKTSGTERMRITSAGFVGINTTGATGGVPGYLFHVFGGTGSTSQTIASIEGNSLTSGIGLSISSNNTAFAGYLEDAQATDATNTNAYTTIHSVAAGNNGQGIIASKSSTTAATAGGANFGGRIAAVFAQTATPNTIAVFGNASDNTATASVGIWGIAANGTNNIGVVGIGGSGSTYTTACTGGAGAYFYGQAYGLYSIGANGVAGKFIRLTGATNTSAQGALSMVAQTTAGTMSDGFGPSLLFYENDGSDNFLGRIDGVRNGLDNSGRLVFQTANAGSMSEKMTVLANGNVGINNSNPSKLFYVDGTGFDATSQVAEINGDNVGSGSALYVHSANITSGWLVELDATNASGTGNALEVSNNSTSSTANTGNAIKAVQSGAAAHGNAVYASSVGAVGYSAIFGTQAPNATGTGWTITNSDHAVAGQISSATNYSFGVFGSTKGGTPTGGVIGYYEPTGAWGSLGYRSTAPNNYGGYGTTVWGNGTGKIMQGSIAVDGIGSGWYGGIMGSWVRGDIYGMTVKGNRYSLYVDGQTYTNDVIVQLSNSDGIANGKSIQKEERIASYVPTSMSVDVYARGTARLINGKATIEYPENFKKLVSTTEPVIVTVTAIGECNGLHLEKAEVVGGKVTANHSFTVSENAKGRSNVEFTWIAIGTRNGYENPQVTKELLAPDYDNNMNDVMHNENDTLNPGKPIWWDGKTLHFTPLPMSGNTPPNNIGNVPVNINQNSGIKPKEGH
ncbi:MAG: hypothetical protein ABR968_11355 [Bacteroidales bacterium]|jgi:hypothetical protein